MDARLIAEKLESLRRCVQRTEDKTPEDYTALVADPDLQDIISLNLTRAVQLCVDIGAHIIADSDLTPPDTMGSVFDHLVNLDIIDPILGDRMKKAIGFRNVAVHNYKEIDWRIVFRISHENLLDFKAFARSVSKLI